MRGTAISTGEATTSRSNNVDARARRRTASRQRMLTRLCHHHERDETFVSLGFDLPHPLSEHVPMDVYAATCDVMHAPNGGIVRLVLPESEDAVVDVYSALGRARDDPHWADLWHGSVALAGAVFASPELVRGKRVIDLGCGLGLGGVAAAMCGAKEGVMTDREERALWCSLAACKANGLMAVKEMPRECNAPDEVELPPLPTFEDAPRCDSDCVVSAAKVDWFEPEKAPTGFDIVLACDVLYTSEAVDAIATLVMRLFDGNASGTDSGKFILADPPGRFPRNHERFMSLMENPANIPGYSGDKRRGIVSVTESIEVCLNLERKPMRVKLSAYDIVGRDD